MTQTIFRIRRYRPGQQETWWQDFTIETHTGMTILEGLQQIREKQDASLSWRHSCRMGVCGSCGMVMNGQPGLACNTQIHAVKDDLVRLEALWNFPVAKDLVSDLTSMFDRHTAIGPYLRRDHDAARPRSELKQSPAELDDYLQFTSCIKCGVCMAACPTLASDAGFLGPMPLTAAHRYNSDSRDAGFAQRKETMAQHHGVTHCHYAAECSRSCPKGVDPARAIQLMKRDLVADMLGVRRNQLAQPVATQEPVIREGLTAPAFTVADK
ncbi:MAG: succinate dehydrogenase/fumarate reductase iron-sulfur subunit [Gammaproteobacteria bacterium]|nr:succinate dehydrogenase/fumarate reductase iron-sulfur subunit [Gammaproteobacteria bacterium]